MMMLMMMAKLGYLKLSNDDNDRVNNDANSQSDANVDDDTDDNGNHSDISAPRAQ